ncbi:MAG: hypothetical protein HYW24_00105 [Candidatus Aenigmarchaeota archaeon]|nr:hypothetical protein [Candidatus Aenigmarchaeota archaeon]
MEPVLVFLIVYVGMIANAFWESYVEGRDAWDKGKLGWKIRIGRYVFTAYHFYLFWVMWPILLSLPLVLYGWDTRLFGVLISAYFSGLVLEDFMWFVVNPAVKLSELNSKFADYYPWLKIWKFEVPLLYISGISIAILSWYLIWRV